MQEKTNKNRRIIHIDMDAFFAAVEQRDYPHYRGKPVIVGGSPQSRGVVSTCSYEARKFGIHSAMPSYMAHKLCPQGIFVRGRYAVYSNVSKQIMNIFTEITPAVEELSLDEAFLDVTDLTDTLSEAAKLAVKIKHKIQTDVKLTASAGVSYNKFLAKLASDMNKPDGLTVITPEQSDDILEKLDIRKIYGIGKATEQKMLDLGVKTGADLKNAPLENLCKHFGKAGKFYYEIIRGIDNREVISTQSRKSFSREKTFSSDTYDFWEMQKILDLLAIEVAEYLNSEKIKGKTITLKIKYEDFKLKTKSLSLNYFIDQAELIAKLSKQLLEVTYNRTKGVRLLGISVSNLNNIEHTSPQLYFDFYDNGE